MKKLQLLIVLLALASEALSSEVDSALAQVGQITENCQSPSSLNENIPSKKVQLGFLRGSPMDAMNAPQAGEDYLQITKRLLQSQGFEVETQSAHHTNWSRVCENFKTRPQHKVVLVGHSYGSSGALKIANCLNEAGIKTEAFIAVSSFDFLAGVNVSVIPTHIKNHLNLWVKDPLISGYKNHTAADSSKTTVLNVEARLSQVAWPHLAAAGRLLPLLSLYSVASVTEQTERLQLPAQISDTAVRTSLNQFWQCSNSNVPVVEVESENNQNNSSEQRETPLVEPVVFEDKGA